MSKILITGINGFVGQAVCKRLRRENLHMLAGTTRQPNFDRGPEQVPLYHIPKIGPDTDWTHAVSGAEIVIHLAARVHIMRDNKSNPLAAFRRVNSEGTKRLAMQAAAAGARRFVFISTVKAAGEESPGRDLTEKDIAKPEDFYGISKWEAEQNLLDIAKTTKMEIVILRAPLIYGPGVKGNFYDLLKVVKSGIVLPFGSIKNNRSLLFVGNFADAIAIAANHPNAGNKTFFVSDDNNISTPELIDKMTLAMGRKSRIFKLPISLLKIIGFFVGRSAAIRRLTGSLTVDINHIKTHLGWHPPFSMEDGLKETTDWFVRNISE